MSDEIYTIEKLGAFGEGVAKKNGKTVFIKGALAGERVLCETTKVKKHFDVATLKKVIKSSPYRVDPPCPYFYRCGGCGLQHMQYSGQLLLKRQTVQETLKKIAGIQIELPEIVPSDKVFGYRNKLSYPICEDKIGLYEENSHNIVDISDCMLQRKWNIPLIKALRKYIGCGKKLRHIVAREKDGGLIITLVTTERTDISDFADFLPFSDFTLYQNVNSTPNNTILSDEFYCMASKGNAPSIHPASFYQVNDYIADRMYDHVLNSVGGESVIDAFCGAGDLTIALAKSAKNVVGVEICSQAIDEAREKVKKSGIENVRFVCGDCSAVLPDIFSSIKGPVTVVFDPPRKGLSGEIINAVRGLSPQKIIYISCNPATLARDLGMLIGDYDIAELKLYDMFPQTTHVETLVLLSKKSAISHIDVRVEFGEGEGQISLKEIKERAEERKPKEKVKIG